MAIPITPVIAAFIDDPDVLPWPVSDKTQERPPQFEKNLARARHCGCQCGGTRSSTPTSGSSTAFDLEDQEDWEMVQSMHSAVEQDDDETYGHANHAPFTFLFPPHFEPEELVSSDMTDSMVVNLSGSTMPAHAGGITTDQHSMADSISSLPRICSDTLLFGTGGLAGDTMIFQDMEIDNI